MTHFFDGCQLKSELGHFKFKGEPSPSLLQELSHPFNLKLLAAVYAGKELPLLFDEKNIIKSYLDIELDGELRHFLKAVAEELIATPIDKGISGKIRPINSLVDADNLKRRLSIPPLSPLPEKAFSRYLLWKSADENGRVLIGFYHGAVQNFVLAFLVLQLDKLAIENLNNEIPKFLETLAGRNALAWYIRFSPESWRDSIQQHTYGKAISFLNAYKTLFLVISPLLFKSLFPEGGIGLVYSGGIKEGMVVFGFRPCLPSDPNLIIETQNLVEEWEIDWTRQGVHQIQFNSQNFANSDPEEIAIELYIDKILRLVEKGQIDWFLNEAFCSEAIYSILSEAYGQFKAILPDRVKGDVDPCEALEPIPLSLIDMVIDYKRAVSYYLNELDKDKFQRGDYQSDGRYITMHTKREEAIPYIQKAIEHVQARKERLDASVEVNFPITTLEKCVANLKSKGIKEIRHPLSRPKQRTIQRRGRWVWSAQLSRYTENEIREYLKTFFSLSEDCFQKILDYNFPTISDILLPPEERNNDILIHFNKNEDQWDFGAWPIKMGYFVPKDKDAPTITVTIEPEKCPIDFSDRENLVTGTMRGAENIFIVTDDRYPFELQSDRKYLRHAVLRTEVLSRLNKMKPKIKEIISQVAKDILKKKSPD